MYKQTATYHTSCVQKLSARTAWQLNVGLAVLRNGEI
jgi:hypothetical protein